MNGKRWGWLVCLQDAPSSQPRRICESGKKEKRERNGDGLAFFNIGLDFEGYFEGLRTLAGDPSPGSWARALPKFEKWWEEEFAIVIELRKRWWQKQRVIAEQAIETGSVLQI